MSTGYLVMRCVTSRMHSCTPFRFSTAKRVTFYKDRDRTQGESGGRGGGQHGECWTWSLCSGAGTSSAIDLMLA